MSESKDVLVSIGLDLDSMKSDFMEMKQAFRQNILNMKKEIAKIELMPATGFKAKNGISKGSMLKGMRHELKTMGIQNAQVMLDMEKAIKPVEKQFKKLSKAMQKTSKKTKTAFDMNALGIMFFGQSIMRVLSTIEKASRQTFQDIMHSVEGNVTAYDKLDTSMKMIQYRIGASLAPLFESFSAIIRPLSGFIQENEGQFRALYVILGLLAAAMSIGGTLILGFKAFGGELGVLNKTLGTSFTKMQALKGIVGAGLILNAGINLIEATIKEGKMSKKALAKFFIEAGAGAFLMNPAIGLALVTVGVALELMPGEFAAQFVSLLQAAFATAALVIASWINLLISPLIGVINSIIGAYNFIKGTDIEKIDTFGLSKTAISKFQDSIDNVRQSYGEEARYDTGSSGTTNVYNIQASNSEEVLSYINSMIGSTNNINYGDL